MRRYQDLIWVFILSSAVAACAHGPGADLKPRRPPLGLHILCQPTEAQIYVDDKYMGTTKGLEKHPLMLSPGMHRVEIRSEGYFAHFAEVELAHGVKQVLKVKLRKEPF